MKFILILLTCFLACESNFGFIKPLKNKEYVRLSSIVERLKQFAPIETATEWDNVGLIVQPSEDIIVEKIFVTNDLTESALDEAIAKKVNLIISYHPPMVGMNTPYTRLKPLTRLTQENWKERAMVKCIENRIAVYTPHTTWDSINGGINDWILSIFDTIRIDSIQKRKNKTTSSGLTKTVKILEDESRLLEARLANEHPIASDLVFINRKNYIFNRFKTNFQSNSEMEFLTNDRGVLALNDLIGDVYKNNTDAAKRVIETMRIYNLDSPLMKNVGLGRIGYLSKKITINKLIQKMKNLLKQKTFRIALGNGKTLNDTISSIAVGAGGGTGLLHNTVADFIISGELLHHDILHETHRGVSVLLSDHSNTERGFIEVFKDRFLKLLDAYNEKVDIIISENDRDPIQYV